VLESARLLREGFLRQSAYDPADASCPPAKAFEMLRLFLEFHGRAASAVGQGVPLRSVLDAAWAEAAAPHPGDPDEMPRAGEVLRPRWRSAGPPRAE